MPIGSIRLQNRNSVATANYRWRDAFSLLWCVAPVPLILASSAGTRFLASSSLRYPERIDDAEEKSGSYALWSGAGPPFDPEQRASTTDDFPNLSSLILPAGVAAVSMVEGVVTEDAVDSIEISSRSLASRSRKTKVSTISCLSRLNEYCAVENVCPLGKSRRMRTNSANACCNELAGAAGPLAMPVIGFAFGSSTDRPRSTSKSGLNEGRFGMRASAVEISCCSAADGEHTFRTFTFTCGFGGFGSCARHMHAAAAIAIEVNIFLRTTAF